MEILEEKMNWKFKFNIMGCPKSGTTAMSKYIKYGIDRHAIFPHECHVPLDKDRNGTCSGFWWIDHDWYPYGHQKDTKKFGENFRYSNTDYDYRIMLIRDPLKTINSLYRLLCAKKESTDNTGERILSHKWYESIGFEYLEHSKYHMAMSVYVNTYEYILSNISLDGIVRIEHCEEDWDKIGTKIFLDLSAPQKELNHTKKKKIVKYGHIDWDGLKDHDINKTNLVERAKSLGERFDYL